jgi:hypothetical protein
VTHTEKSESNSHENPVEDKRDTQPVNLPMPLQTLTKNRAQSVNAKKRLSTKVPSPVTEAPPKDQEASILFQYLVAASKKEKEEYQPESKRLSVNLEQPTPPTVEVEQAPASASTESIEPIVVDEEKKPNIPGGLWHSCVSTKIMKRGHYLVWEEWVLET